ncbi:RNA ligase (ATP) [Achromobacter sp. AGC39]
MSEFSCPVVEVRIEPHPNADAIEIAVVGGFQSIVKKGQFRTGEHVVYIPENALVPEWLLRHLGMYDDVAGKGRLAGSGGDRVKAIKLRGIVSQGLIVGTIPYGPGSVLVASTPHEGNEGAGIVDVGADASSTMGVVKYEPVVPASMAGRAIGADLDITHKYDFENIKKHPELIEEGHPVVMTEKIHGTLLQIVVVPESKANDKFYRRRVAITSKGLGGRGILLDHEDEGNVYAQAVKKHGLLDKMLLNFGEWADHDSLPIAMFGEVFGNGIQDLGYGASLQYRAFDICVGVRENAKFLIDAVFEEQCNKMGVARAPVLYRGPYGAQALNDHTNGKSTIGGDHIREGVVVKSAVGGIHPRYGRKIAKSISDAYLLRKNATEFN